MPRTRNDPSAYLERLNRVLDHIRADPGGAHTVDSLAAIACFSPFHFHRVFTSLIGETVGSFVRRVRLERAVALMKALPGRSLSRIALQSGFASLSDMSRAFRAAYGMAPARWDRATPLMENRKNRQADDPCRRYTDAELARDHAAGTFPVSIRERPALRVAYLRIANSYDVETTLAGYSRFIVWLRERGGGALPDGELIGVSHDDPDVTPPEQCRYDFCFTVTGEVAAGGEIAIREMPACTVACVHIDGDVGVLSRAWDYLYRYWLPRSRWQPANLPAMEIYRRTPEEVGWEWFDLDGCVPVEPL